MLNTAVGSIQDRSFLTLATAAGLVKGEADHQGLTTGGKCRSGRGKTGSARAEKFGYGPEPSGGSLLGAPSRLRICQLNRQAPSGV